MDQMQTRRVLGKAIKSALRGHGLTQEDLSRLTGFDTSKTSRLVRGQISADAETVDAILDVFPDKRTKFEIVSAYIHDATTAKTRTHFAISPKSSMKAGTLDITHLSPSGSRAVTYIMEQISAKHELENLFIEFAKATGWPGMEKKRKLKSKNDGLKGQEDVENDG